MGEGPRKGEGKGEEEREGEKRGRESWGKGKEREGLCS